MMLKKRNIFNFLWLAFVSPLIAAQESSYDLLESSPTVTSFQVLNNEKEMGKFVVIKFANSLADQTHLEQLGRYPVKEVGLALLFNSTSKTDKRFYLETYQGRNFLFPVLSPGSKVVQMEEILIRGSQDFHVFLSAEHPWRQSTKLHVSESHSSLELTVVNESIAQIPSEYDDSGFYRVRAREFELHSPFEISFVHLQILDEYMLAAKLSEKEWTALSRQMNDMINSTILSNFLTEGSAEQDAEFPTFLEKNLVNESEWQKFLERHGLPNNLSQSSYLQSWLKKVGNPAVMWDASCAFPFVKSRVFIEDPTPAIGFHQDGSKRFVMPIFDPASGNWQRGMVLQRRAEEISIDFIEGQSTVFKTQKVPLPKLLDK